MDKNLKLFMVASVTMFCLVSFNNFALSDETAPCRIAVVDIQKVVANSSEAKAIQQEQRKKIDGLTRFIEKGRLSIDKEKDPQKQQELEQRLTKELNEKKNAIDTEYANKLSLVEQDIRSTIETKAKDKGYDLVLMKSVVLFGGTDITDEVSKAVK